MDNLGHLHSCLGHRVCMTLPAVLVPVDNMGQNRLFCWVLTAIQSSNMSWKMGASAREHLLGLVGTSSLLPPARPPPQRQSPSTKTPGLGMSLPKHS